MILVVSGTGTGVGKTVVTAGLAALAASRGERVAVVKPAQTGIGPGPARRSGLDGPAEPSDLDEVTRLSGVSDVHELARFPDPLSPEAAARVAGLPPLDMAFAAAYVTELAANRDLVLVEGAGGLLVRYDPAGSTICTLASLLSAPVLIVTAAGLGTLNHTALTLEALAFRDLACAGLVIGAWPASPGLAELCNLDDLAGLVPGRRGLAGRLPDGAAALDRDAFLAVASAGLSRPLTTPAPAFKATGW